MTEVALRQLSVHEAPTDGAAQALRVLSLQATVLSHTSFRLAATAFASELAVQNGCTRVSVGFVKRGFVRLAATSHGGSASLDGPAFDRLAEAMDEAILRGDSIVLPSNADVAPIRLAHTRLLAGQGAAVVTVPIAHLDALVGAVSFEWTTPPADLPKTALTLENTVSLIGPVLDLLRLREVPWHERMVNALKRGWVQLLAPEQQLWRIAMVALVLALAGLLLVPVEYRVGGQARIEGEQQRALVAPADGFLKAAHARPGDTVKQGQLLVEMADQDLTLQRRKWASELGQHESAYATALARSDRPAMVIALSRTEEARAHLDLIEAELARSRITAPFDGIVIQGDLSQNLGAPVERGKPLMLMAPNGKYRVVVRVDERDIADVRVGQTGLLSLSALPWDALPIRVTRLTPIATSVEGNNVFEVEAALDASAEQVRPGLEGVAKISVGRQSLAWAWFHRLGNWLRITVWTWLP